MQVAMNPSAGDAEKFADRLIITESVYH